MALGDSLTAGPLRVARALGQAPGSSPDDTTAEPIHVESNRRHTEAGQPRPDSVSACRRIAAESLARPIRISRRTWGLFDIRETHVEPPQAIYCRRYATQ